MNILPTIMGGPASGTLAGIVGLVSQKCYTAYKVKQLSTLKFESKYENNGLIESEDIQALMTIQNKVLRKELIQKMDFRQLYFAKQALSEKEFQKNITVQDVESLSHSEAINRWFSHFSTVSNIQTIGELKQKLQTRWGRRNIKKDPLGITALCEAWKSIHHQDIQSITTSSRIYLFLKSKSPSQEKVTINVEGHPPITINRARLIQNSIYFQAMLKGSLSESKMQSIEMKEIEDFEAFKKYIKILNCEEVFLDPPLILKLVKLADVYTSLPLLALLDHYIAAHAHLFSREDLLELAMEYPNFKKILALLENESLNHQLTDENWEETIQEADQCGFARLKKKCKDFALLRLHDTRDSIWLDRCKEIISSRKYERLSKIFNSLKGKEEEDA